MVIKISPGLSIRCPTTLHSVDYLFSNWNDPAKALTRAEGYIGASLNLLSDWQEKVVDNKKIRYIKVHIKEDWSLNKGIKHEDAI